MRHFVLTRSAYGPEWSRAANLRRLQITKGVTARLMALQTFRDWEWIVLVDPRDPLLADRLAVFGGGGVPVHPLYWQPDNPEQAPWDRSQRTTVIQRIAATGYKAPWRSVIPDDLVLQTRIDDDDGFAVDALARFHAVGRHLKTRTVLMLPEGFRVFDGRYTRVHQENNAMHSLVTPAGDALCIYDYGHMQTARGGHRDLEGGVRAPRQGTHRNAPAPLVIIDQKPAWLWIRHRDTISGHQRALRPVTQSLRDLFPIDWSVLGL